MPTPGDTIIAHGRSYVWFDPQPATGPGTWVLTGSGPLVNSIANPNANAYSDIVAPTSIDIKAGMLLYRNTLGQVAAASAKSIITAKVVGAAIADAAAGTSVQYVRNSRIKIAIPATCVDGGNLVANTYYYLSENPGFWTANPDTTTQDYVSIQCGLCTNASPNAEIEIEIQPPVVI
jgi:hypothetical protein